MESILATAFGRVINIQKGESNQLTEAAALFFSAAHENKKTSQFFILMLLSKLNYLQWIPLKMRDTVGPKFSLLLIDLLYEDKN